MLKVGTEDSKASRRLEQEPACPSPHCPLIPPLPQGTSGPAGREGAPCDEHAASGTQLLEGGAPILLSLLLFTRS